MPFLHFTFCGFKFTDMSLSHSPVDVFIEQQGFVILDGGLATELEKRGHNLNNKLWSAGLLREKPEEIQQVHKSYLEAGADCIVTATYQASFPGFEEAGIPKREAIDLFIDSVALTVETRDQFWENNPDVIRPLVAVSIGPYGAYLADGSEFRGDYTVTKNDLRIFHEPRWKLLSSTAADLFAIETIPNFQEAEVLLELLQSTPDIHAWISFSCKDDFCISDGTPISVCAALFADCEQIAGIGINCTAPQYLPSLIREVTKGAPNKPVVVYPNSGEIFDEHQKTWSCGTEPVRLDDEAKEWFDLGARLIGGCCRTTPKQILGIKAALQKFYSPQG
jgi:homocysteine S-methyltransferase